MSDWEVVGDEEQHASAPMQSDWGAVPFESQEESFLHKLPRNILIGLTHAGRGLHNLPHDIASGVDYVGSGIGRALGAKEFQNGQSSHIADYLPYDTQNYADVFGQKGQGTTADNMIQKGVEYAPDVIGGANALRRIGLLPHLTQRGASRRLRNARQLGIDQNMGNLDIDPHLIEDMRQYQPANTLPFRNQMDAAHTGNYQALFDLQSEVGREAASRARTLFSPAQRSHGRAGLQARNDLIEDMHRDMQLKGHHNVSNEFRQGQEDYRRFARFRPYRNAIAGAAISAAVAAALPKNALTNLIKKLITHSNE